MTDAKQAEGSAVCFFGLIIVCFFGFMTLASLESHRYIQGVVVVDANYVHYLLNNSRGELCYRIGSNSTQPQVQLCRVYSNQYARCTKTATGSSVAPLSDFDALVLGKLHTDGILDRKPYSINYSRQTEAP